MSWVTAILFDCKCFPVALTYCMCVVLVLTEMCLLHQGQRLSTVRALTVCQLFSLSVTSFQEVLQRFPEMKKDVAKMAENTNTSFV